jgi:non-ribosomal peptide synthetase component F
MLAMATPGARWPPGSCTAWTSSTRPPSSGLAGAWSRCLEQVAADDPTSPSPSWSCSTPRSGRRCWRSGTATGGVPRRPLLHELFEAQAARTPDGPAVTFEGASLAYGELNERANRWRTTCGGWGWAPRCGWGSAWSARWRWWSAILAVLKAGGAYVPLDPGYPAERLAFMLDDAGIAVLAYVIYTSGSTGRPRAS